MSGTLPLYWKLASDDPAERLQASSQLIDQLVPLVADRGQKPIASISQQPPDGLTNGKSAALPSQAKLFNDSFGSSGENRSEGTSGFQSNVLRPNPAEVARIEQVLESELPTEVSYAIKRLVRGLASPRQSSRIGFATTLTELLHRTQIISIDDVLTIVLQYTKAEGKATGQEERDALFAKLFAVEAVCLSGLLVNPTNATYSSFERAVEILLSASNKKTWLGESCAWILINIVRAVRGNPTLPFRGEALDWLRDRLFGRAPETGTKAISMDKLAVLLDMQHGDASSKEEQKQWKHLVPPLKHSNVLHHSNLKLLARMLKDSPVVQETQADEPTTSYTKDGKKVDNGGSWRPDLPLAWNLILDIYLGPTARMAAEAGDNAPFTEFFRTAVEETLFAPQSSSERKLWGFQVLQGTMQRLASSEALKDDEAQGIAQHLFGANLMRSLINHLSKKDRYLHAAAVKTVEEVHAAIKLRPVLGFVVLSQLLGEHGHISFDKITNSKTVEGVLACLPISGVKEYLKLLVQVANGTDNVEFTSQSARDTNLETRRKWALDQMLLVVRQSTISKDDEAITAVLQYLIVHGFAEVKKAQSTSLMLGQLPTEPFDKQTREACKSRFLSCMGDLIDQTTSLPASGASGPSDGESKVRKVQGVTSQGERWVSKAVDLFLAVKQDKKCYKWLEEDTPPEGAEAWEEAHKVLLQCRQARSPASQKKKKGGKEPRKSTSELSSGQDEEQRTAFESLLCAGLLFCAKENTESEEVLGPLTMAYEALYGGEAVRDADSPSAVDVLIDAIVACIQQASAFLRSAALQTFAAFSSEMDGSAMDHILQQLGTGEEGEAGEEEDVEEEDEEMLDAAEEEEMEMTSDTSDSSSDEDEESLDGKTGARTTNGHKDDVDPIIREKVRAVLQEANLAEGDDDDDEEEEDGDDASDDSSSVDMSDMDDDQMMALDEKLGEIFKLQSANKKAAENAKVEAMAFQNRILDLLDLYARKQAGNPLLLKYFRPLLEIVKDSEKDEQQLKNKAAGLLQNRVCKAKEPLRLRADSTANEGEVQEALDVLERVQQEVRSTTDKQLSAVCSSANLYLTRSIVGALHQAQSTQQKAYNNLKTRLVSIYNTTLSDFIDRKQSTVKPTFLQEAFSRPLAAAPGATTSRTFSLGWELRTQVLDACRPNGSGTAAKAFRQMQAFQFLQGILTLEVQQRTTSSSASSASASGAGKKVDEFTGFLGEVAQVVLDVVQIACASSSAEDSGAGEKAGGSGMNATRLKDVIKFGMQAARSTRRVLTSQSTSASASASTPSQEGKANGKTKSNTLTESESKRLKQIWQSEGKMNAVDGALRSCARFKDSPSIQSLWKQFVVLAGGTPSPTTPAAGTPAQQGGEAKKAVKGNGKDSGKKMKRASLASAHEEKEEPTAKKQKKSKK